MEFRFVSILRDHHQMQWVFGCCKKRLASHTNLVNIDISHVYGIGQTDSLAGEYGRMEQTKCYQYEYNDFFLPCLSDTP